MTVSSMENFGTDFLLRIPLKPRPGAQLFLPVEMHDDPLNRGSCKRVTCTYPFGMLAAPKTSPGPAPFTIPLQ